MPMTDLVVKLTGKDSNVFSLIGTVAKELKRNGHSDLADEMINKIHNESSSFEDAIRMMGLYVEIV